MRLLKIMLPTVLFLFCTLSCRKYLADGEYGKSYSTLKVQTFLKEKLATIPLDKKADFINLINRIDYSTVLTIENIKGNSFVLALANYDFSTPPNHKVVSSVGNITNAKTILTKVVFDCNKSGDIISGTISQIETDMPISKVEGDVKNILTSKSKDFSGTLSTNSLENNVLFKTVYDKGRVGQISSRQSRPGDLKLKSTNSKQYKTNLNQVGCTDWYWVTTYHFTDGSFFTEEIYLNTTCDESYPPNGEGGIFTTSPCDKIKLLKNDTALVNKMNLLKTKVTEFSETGYLMRRGYQTTFDLLTSAPGSVGAIEVNPSAISGTIDGILHNHTSGLLSIFSGGDLQAISILFDASKLNSLQNFTMTAITASQTAYVLSVSDVTAFNSFRSTYLTNSVGMNLFENLYESVYGISKNATSANNEKNFLKLLKDTNSGLQLTSVDFDTFTKWNIKSLDANNTVISVPCTN